MEGKAIKKESTPVLTPKSEDVKGEIKTATAYAMKPPKAEEKKPTATVRVEPVRVYSRCIGG